MPATLLAVDDSQTMRKVLEMTFAGEDVRVVTAEGFDAALALVRSESPAVVVADITLPGKTGYDLCQAIKQANPALPVLLLSSKLHPYDAGKGQAVRADGNIDKPFDTQQLIDRVKALLSGDRRVEAPRAGLGAPKAAAPTPYRAPAPLSATMVGTPPAKPPAPAAAPVRPAAAAPASAPVRPSAPQPSQNLRSTIDFSAKQESPVRAAPPAASPVVARPAAPPPAAAAPATPAPVVAAAALKADGEMAAKLSEMGLSKDQVDAVLALSQDVVERVVWEVVPVLAETLIKEEIKRLMAE